MLLSIIIPPNQQYTVTQYQPLIPENIYSHLIQYTQTVLHTACTVNDVFMIAKYPDYPQRRRNFADYRPQ